MLLMDSVPIVLAAIVRGFDGANLISLEPGAFQRRFSIASEPSVQTNEQCLSLGVAQAIEQCAEQHAFLVRTAHERGPFGFCDFMSSSK